MHDRLHPLYPGAHPAPVRFSLLGALHPDRDTGRQSQSRPRARESARTARPSLGEDVLKPEILDRPCLESYTRLVCQGSIDGNRIGAGLKAALSEETDPAS